MAKRKKSTHNSFESNTEHGRFAKITQDMMNNVAWQALTLRQRGLYLHLKSKYTQRVEHGIIINSNEKDISIPASEAKILYGDLRTFRKDMDALIECGFIDLIESGRNTRTCNIYGFSDRWKNYGKADYQVPIQFKRKKLANTK